jgi:hypothetical protein
MYILYMFILNPEICTCMFQRMISLTPYFPLCRSFAQHGFDISGIIQECKPCVKQGINVDICTQSK